MTRAGDMDTQPGMSKSPELRAYSGWIKLAQRLAHQGPPLLHAMALVGINRLQVAKGCGVTAAAVAQWAANHRPIPARHKAHLIAFLSVWAEVARSGGVKLSLARKVKRIAAHELQNLDGDAKALYEQHRTLFHDAFAARGPHEPHEHGDGGGRGGGGGRGDLSGRGARHRHRN